MSSNPGPGGAPPAPSFFQQITAAITAVEPALRWIAIILVAGGVIAGKISTDQAIDWVTHYDQGLGAAIAKVQSAAQAPGAQ